MPLPIKVAIISEGEYGSVKREEGHYDRLEAGLKRWLEEAEWPNNGGKRAEVRVVKNSEEALSWLDNRGAMVFVTRGMLHKAKEIAKRHPRIRIVLLTGLIPEGEVIFIDKAYLDQKQAEAVILG